MKHGMQHSTEQIMNSRHQNGFTPNTNPTAKGERFAIYGAWSSGWSEARHLYFGYLMLYT